MEPLSTVERIGIIGGSFDPLHMGHLVLAQDAAEKLELSQVVFVPAARPPHKQHIQQAGPEHRLRMIELAVQSNQRFTVSDLELRRDGLSYTVDTVAELRRSHPLAAWYLLVGSDTLMELHMWHRINELLEMCEVAAVLRPGADDRAAIRKHLELTQAQVEQVTEHLIDTHRIGISSTEIRAMVAAGRSISYLVPPEVEAYILENELYRD
jgi:nicotinate-nucleotide adenylyltransferase